MGFLPILRQLPLRLELRIAVKRSLRHLCNRASIGWLHKSKIVRFHASSSSNGLIHPFAAGHWAPEMVALAGGQEVLGQAGEKSFRVTWQQVIDAQPDVILIAPCGYSQEQATAEWAALAKPEGWGEIPAVQHNRIYALDANSYCSRPAPRVVDGIEQLAMLLHPTLVSA
ncbi:MAG: ABC transporter substrate-binding protein [Caldilineaceae bacterium]